ncbi:MAG: 2-phospho-L-lactate guanylyltransferase [Acidimicrobiia bacterium]|nr:2-phospho-L-lactate guanylyltransferase [Acidimicrobiia bacterium]
MTAAAGVVVPVRAFRMGKARLAPHLGEGEREAFARAMATRVVSAAGDRPIVVVSSAPEVRAWSVELDLAILDDPGSLDAAADAGRSFLAERGVRRVVVAHADLPRASSLGSLARDGGRPIVAAVPCHRDDGTPVLSVPVEIPFRFSYGPGSFRRHAAEARRLGLGFRVVRDARLAFDVDIPDDLLALDAAFPRPGAPLAARSR